MHFLSNKAYFDSDVQVLFGKQQCIKKKPNENSKIAAAWDDSKNSFNTLFAACRAYPS
jgi:hypothetical protein